MTCNGCYNSFSGWWCDNCDTWPCECLEPEKEAPKDPIREGIEYISSRYGEKDA